MNMHALITRTYNHPWTRYHVIMIQLCSLAYLEVDPCHKPAPYPPCTSAPLVSVRVQSSTPPVTGVMSHKGGTQFIAFITNTVMFPRHAHQCLSLQSHHGFAHAHTCMWCTHAYACI